MEVVIRADADEVGAAAADRIAALVRAIGRAPVLGVATGSSPLATYARLAGLVRQGSLDLTGASAFALDEYVGLPPGHPQRYASVVARTVTGPLGLSPARVHVPDGAATDLGAAADDYERLIAEAGGVDVQVLGVGTNGHLGFNEPSSSLVSRTRLKTLSERTRLDNARFFDDLADVPRYCLTQGIGTILDARHLVLVAHGQAKADAVAALVEGPVSAMCPASALQLHASATVVVDEAAASGLRLADFYRDISRARERLAAG